MMLVSALYTLSFEDHMKLLSTANVKQFENFNKLGTALSHIKEMMLVCGSWSVSLAAMITTALLLALAVQAHAAEVVTLLHSFSGGNDGAFPYAGLTADAAGNLYGTSQIAGANGFGMHSIRCPTLVDRRLQ